MVFAVLTSQCPGPNLLNIKGMVLGLTVISSFDSFEGCIYYKQTRKSFPFGKAWGLLVVLKNHDDLCCYEH